MNVRVKKEISLITKMHQSRFEKLLLSVDEAIIDAGRKTQKQKIIEQSIQNDAKRQLLKVEEIANKKREVEANANSAFLSEVEETFHESVSAQMADEVKDIIGIKEKFLKFNDNLGRMLDILYTDSCTISRLVTCLEELPWLSSAILTFVRQPKYRRVDSKGNPIVLKTIRSALSFVGIESLRTLLPVLIARHANPEKSPHTPDMTRNMWIYTIGAGNVAKAISEKNQVRPHFGFCAALFSNIGRTVVANLYLKVFDKLLTEQVIKAQRDNDPNHAKALASLSPSHKYIIQYTNLYANKISSQVIAKLNCKWLNIAGGLVDFAKIRELDIDYIKKNNLHPLAKVLFQAHGFMQYKMLAKDGLISREESMMYLRAVGIDSNDVSIVAKINLTGIDITISGNLPEDMAE